MVFVPASPHVELHGGSFLGFGGVSSSCSSPWCLGATEAQAGTKRAWSLSGRRRQVTRLAAEGKERAEAQRPCGCSLGGQLAHRAQSTLLSPAHLGPTQPDPVGSPRAYTARGVPGQVWRQAGGVSWATASPSWLLCPHSASPRQHLRGGLPLPGLRSVSSRAGDSRHTHSQPWLRVGSAPSPAPGNSPNPWAGHSLECASAAGPLAPSCAWPSLPRFSSFALH